MAKYNTTDIKNFRLRELRRKNHITQQELADYLKMTRGAYQHLETKGQLTDDVLVKLSRFFQIPIEEIVGSPKEDTFPGLMQPAALFFDHRVLSSDEARLLEIYSQLSPDAKTKLLGYLDCLSEQE